MEIHRKTGQLLIAFDEMKEADLIAQALNMLEIRKEAVYHNVAAIKYQRGDEPFTLTLSTERPSEAMERIEKDRAILKKVRLQLEKLQDPEE